MGTTAEKGARVLQSIAEVQEGINNLGGSLTDQTPFKDFKAQLDEIYNNLPKTEFEEGESVTLENTLKGKLDFDDGKVGFGQASQETTTGTNLANTLGYIAPTTTNGITYSLENNIISLNGTSTASFYINLPGKFDLASGNYTFAPADISGTYTGVCGKYPCVNGTDIFDGNQLSTLVNRTSNSDYTNVFIRLFVSNGSSYSNYKCKLNLVKGTYTSQTIPAWEPYTGGQASPNPSYPQEIKCVRGKNIFNISSAEYFMWLYTNGQYGVSTDPNLLSEFIKVQKGQNYVFSGIPSAYSIRVCSYTTQNVSSFKTCLINNLSNVYDFTADADYIRFAIGNADTRTLDKIQLEEGTQATPYLPYNTIEEVVSGKNLLNIADVVEGYISGADGSITQSSSNNEGTVSFIKAKPNTTYTFKIFETSWSGFESSNWFAFGEYTTNNTSGFITRKTSSSSTQDYFTITTGNTTKYISVSARGLLSATKAQLEEGSTATDYEPYVTPKTYQFSLGDHKFYGIGTYRDYILRTTGKNLLNPSRYIHAVVNATIGSTGTLSEWATSWTTWIEMKPNQTYVFSGNLSNVNSNVARAFVTNSEVAIGTSVTRVDNLSNGTTYTNTGNYKYLVLEFLDVTSYQGNWQVEEGSTATDYEPYGVGVWYKYGEVGEILLDGTNQSFSGKSGFTTNHVFFTLPISDILAPPNNDTDVNMLSNYFLHCKINALASNRIGFGCRSDKMLGFGFTLESQLDTLEKANTWLITHNIDVLYPLATPTYTPITGTLAEQLEAWWNGQSLDGTTIIEGNGDLPMIIKCRALKGE